MLLSAVLNTLANLGALLVMTFSKPLNQSRAKLLPNSTTVAPTLKTADTIALPILTAPMDVITS